MYCGCGGEAVGPAAGAACGRFPQMIGGKCVARYVVVGRCEQEYTLGSVGPTAGYRVYRIQCYHVNDMHYLPVTRLW